MVTRGVLGKENIGRLVGAETESSGLRDVLDVMKWREQVGMILLCKVGHEKKEIDKVFAGGRYRVQ